MTNQALISLAKEYLIVGGLLTVAGVLIFIALHHFVWKKRAKSTKKLNVFKVLIFASFAIYIMVVLGATLIRINYSVSSVFYFHPFSSYKTAWNSGSYTEWRNLILNILMFVPLGIYLPMIFAKFRKFYIVYGVGFLCSLGIELTQVLLMIGVGEIDDLFNNTLGTMIGYGIFAFFYTIISRKKENDKGKCWKVICLQLPLILTILAFCSLYVSYNTQEFGNLTCEKTYTIKMKDVSITTGLELSESNETASVYELPIYTAEELLVKGNEFLANFDATIDEEETKVYDDTIVFQSKDGSYHLWMDYKGGGFWFINFEINEEMPDTTLSEEEIREILVDVGVDVPEEAEYVSLYSEQEVRGNVFYADSIVEGNIMSIGNLNCDINADGVVMEMNNYIYEYTYVTECEIYSEKEIYNQVVAGEFSYYGVDKLENLDMTVESMDITYALDSKGFYQPVYVVSLLSGEEMMYLTLPALR
ncbi:MAG: VanZ family protein [Eubacteriales bacterium]